MNNARSIPRSYSRRLGGLAPATTGSTSIAGPATGPAGMNGMVHQAEKPGVEDVQTSASVHLVYVWDLPTRLFHWLLVGAVLVALLTGFVAPNSWMGVHLAAGYLIVALLVFRLIWGVFGPEYSRISSMVRATRRLPEHLRGLLLLRPRHHLGHNPAGSLMIFALFGVLTALVVTGLLVQGGEEKQGPLAGLVRYAVGHGAKGFHEALVWLLLAMVGGHVAGVLLESLLLRSPLVRAMITGWIPLPAGTAAPEHARIARPATALACLAAFAASAALAIGWLSRLPPLGIPVMPVDQAWVAECGGCHQPFHPSLLPRASWAALMNGLDDHFGEDASLPEAKARPIAAFLDLLRCRSLGHRGGAPLRRRLGCRTVADHGDAILGSQARGAAARAVQRARGTVQGQLLGLPHGRRERPFRRPGHPPAATDCSGSQSMRRIPAGAGRRLPCAGRSGGRGRSGA